MRDYTFKLARALKVVGLMNIQFAVQNGKVFVIEVNPRASRTVPYVSKATGVTFARLAAQVVVLADRTKIGRPGTIYFLPLSEIDLFITDGKSGADARPLGRHNSHHRAKEKS